MSMFQPGDVVWIKWGTWAYSDLETIVNIDKDDLHDPFERLGEECKKDSKGMIIYVDKEMNIAGLLLMNEGTIRFVHTLNITPAGRREKR